MSHLTQAALRELLHYDPATGEFLWAGNRRVGQPVGHMHHGYLRVSLGRYGVHYGHRLAWLYVTGEWPSKSIDHADCDRSNNQWSNLRLARPDQNAANCRRSIRNIAGAKGVISFRGGYRAKICVRGEDIYLGDFNSLAEAAAAYAGAAKIAFGEFARVA